MITSSTAPRIASVIARKSSISYEGTPSGVRAWMWMCVHPSSTARRASSAYSSGVYGIAGHCSRFATAPEIEFVMMTGSSTLNPAPLSCGVGSATSYPNRLSDLEDQLAERAALVDVLQRLRHLVE